MSYNFYNDVTLKNGDKLKLMDKAYNKNKREQVEDPHKVAAILSEEDKYYIILETPIAEEYIVEPYPNIEKYHKYVPEHKETVVKKVNIPELGDDLSIEIKKGE